MSSATLTIKLSVSNNYNELPPKMEMLTQGLDHAQLTWVTKATMLLKDYIVANIQRNTGATAGSIESLVEMGADGATGYVYSQSEVARFLEWGTKRHWVGPADPKGVLHWITPEGGNAFSKGHYVSGIPAYANFRKAGEVNRGELQRMYEAEVSQAFNRAFANG